MVSVHSSDERFAQKSRKELYHIVFSTLSRLEIDASPVNYELMYDIMSGNNPELREKFARLPRPVSQDEIEALARIYLPHHFGKSIHDVSATRLQSELTTLQESLLSGQNSLSSYTRMLGQASGNISSVDPSDTNAIQSELAAIRHITEVQHSRSTQILDRVSGQISAVAAIASEAEEFERTKFKHLVTNLANRRGFNKKLAELYGGERSPGETSLLLCNLLSLEPFNAIELLKVKEAFLERLGLAVTRAMQPTDFAAWLDRPQIGVLIGTATETEIQKTADHLRKVCLVAFDRGQASLPAIVARFGCTTTYTADTASELVGQAERALQIATETTSDRVVFFSGIAPAGGRKNWTLYRS